MGTKSKVVAIIGARGGSRGVPRKNVALLLGKPLIHYTIKAAKASKYIDRVIVSTDDEEIAKIATQEGAETPFLRPAELAKDTATAESFLTHAVNWLEENEGYVPDIVVYLQITDLRRKKGIIDSCIKVMIDNPKIESCFVATPTHKHFWREENGKYVRVTSEKYEPRQKAKDILYREDSGIACATRPRIVKQGRRIGDNVVIIPDEGIDIDIHDYLDLQIAEMFMIDEIKKGDSRYYL